jgi:hypothetical protein
MARVGRMKALVQNVHTNNPVPMRTARKPVRPKASAASDWRA